MSDQETKYGGHNSQEDWKIIRRGLSNKLVEANMGAVISSNIVAKKELEEARKRCVAKAYQCFEFASKKEYLDTFPLEQVLQAIKVIDRHELQEALRLKTPKGFADRLIHSHNFD